MAHSKHLEHLVAFYTSQQKEGKDAAGTAARFETLDLGSILAIVTKLGSSDLARMRAVCKSWKAVADNLEVRKAVFKSTWGLGDLEGEPKKQNFYLAAGLGHFVLKQRLTSRNTVASFIVKYKLDQVALRVVNNSPSLDSLKHRSHIYIPVTHRQQLLGRTVVFTHDPICARQLIVVKDADHANPATGSVVFPLGEADADTMDVLARGNNAIRAKGGITQLDSDGGAAAERESLVKKLSKHMGRGLGIDTSTAEYYLDCARGDLKRAFELFHEDRQWEEGHPVGMLPLREHEAPDDVNGDIGIVRDVYRPPVTLL